MEPPRLEESTVEEKGTENEETKPPETEAQENETESEVQSPLRVHFQDPVEEEIEGNFGFGFDLEHRFCYLCNETILTEEYLYHLMQYHPVTLSVMYSLYYPEVEAEELYPRFLHHTLDSIVDHMDYGSLQELCDMIGYHKVGISDITTISNIKDKTELLEEDMCPICMDALQEKETVYVMNACSHMYCKECIETWVSENKTCPVCKTEFQIPSMSKEPSESSPSSESDDVPSSAAPPPASG